MTGNHCNYYSFGVLLMAVAYVGGGGESYAIEFSLLLRYPAGANVSEARKALKTQACPGIGRVRVAPPLL